LEEDRSTERLCAGKTRIDEHLCALLAFEVAIMEEEFLKFLGNILLSIGADGNKIWPLSI
jgi:hypothetical protein